MGLVFSAHGLMLSSLAESRLLGIWSEFMGLCLDPAQLVFNAFFANT